MSEAHRRHLAFSAGQYLSLGLSVIALTGKMPNGLVHRHGLKDALSGAPESAEDYEFIWRFFGHPETTGVGILTGLPYVVVDIDGEEGAQQWENLLLTGGATAMLDDSEPRWVAQTGRGLHLWYSTPWNLRPNPDGDGLVGPPTIKLGSKLDLKGLGGYVAAPPSLHPDGRTYTWLVAPGAEAPFEAPEQLARRIHQHMTQLERRIGGREQRKPIRGKKFESGDTVFFAQSGFDGIIDAVLNAEEGNRNNMLHWAAATMAEEGAEEEQFIALAEAASKAQLERVEIDRTIRSARRSFGG